MNNKKISSFYDPVYDKTIYILYNTNQKEIDRFFKSKKIVNTYFNLIDEESDTPPCGMVGEIHINDTETFIVCFFKAPLDLSDSNSVGKIIGHEVFHIFLTILQYSGAEVDPNNQEPSAYYFGFLMHETIASLQKLIK